MADLPWRESTNERTKTRTTTLLAFVTGHENEREDYYAEFRVTFEVEPGDPSEFHERGYARGCPQVRPCFHLISAEAISIVLADRSHIFGADDALTDRALKHYIETQVHSAYESDEDFHDNLEYEAMTTAS